MLINKGCIFHQLPIKSKSYFQWKQEHNHLLKKYKFDVVYANADAGNGPLLKIAYGRADVPDEYQKYAIRIGNSLDVGLHAFITKVFGDRGYCSKHATAKFLEWADKFNPDVLWLHNIHDYYISIEMLFKWIKNRPNMQVKWTHHDCWAFTGYCSCFSHIGCEKWKNECSNC